MDSLTCSVCCEGEFHVPGDIYFFNIPRVIFPSLNPLLVSIEVLSWGLEPVHHEGVGEGCWGLEHFSPPAPGVIQGYYCSHNWLLLLAAKQSLPVCADAVSHHACLRG